MSELILPEYLAAKIRKAETTSEPVPEVKEEPKGALEQAFVLEEDRVLDPTRIPESAMERLPKPTGWRILVLPYKGTAKTKGGVFLADEYVERQSLATVVAYVLAVGPTAYQDKDKFPDGPWCKKGDWIMLGRYAGARFRIEGGEVRILNDDEIIATISDPSDVLNV
uniref:Co-chaperonin GroES n=1 Tax=uncultured virus TaxID=340016 RepID=A0A221S365_9VIRU|nr:co-chaperonin GroES [uncultured virus]